MNLILNTTGHPQELLGRRLARPDTVFGTVTQVVGVGGEVKGPLGHQAHLFPVLAGQFGGSDLGFAHLSERQWIHRFGKGSRPTAGGNQGAGAAPS